MKKGTLIFSVIVIILIVVGAYFWGANDNSDVNISTSNAPVASTGRPVPNQQKDEIYIERRDGTYKLNIATKELQRATRASDGVRTFPDLPQETKNKKIVVAMTQTLLSRDTSKVIVVFTTFDATKEPSGFDGSLPALKADEFICDIAKHTCDTADILARAYKATGIQGSWFEYPMVRWFQWDSKKNTLYGHLAGEGVGNASPVFAFSATDGSLRKTVGHDSLDTKEKRSEVPAGAFSPSLDKVVMIDESGKKWSLLLYKSDDLSAPFKTYDVSSMNDAAYGWSRISSVAWSSDETFLVLETNRQIFILNTATGGITLIYTDTTPHESGLWLDFNTVALSPSGRYVVFVDYEQGGSRDNTLHTVLKAIDLADSDKVLELLREDGLILSDER